MTSMQAAHGKNQAFREDIGVSSFNRSLTAFVVVTLIILLKNRASYMLT